jgi:hypothetical protein
MATEKMVAQQLAIFLVAQVQEALRILYDNSFSSGQDKALFTPLGKDAADGEESCAGHLTKFLTGEGNHRPSRRLLTDLLKQPEKSESHPFGNLLSGHLAETFFQFIQPIGKNLTDIAPNLGILDQ